MCITDPDDPAFNVSTYEGENKTATVLINVEVSLKNPPHKGK